MAGIRDLTELSSYNVKGTKQALSLRHMRSHLLLPAESLSLSTPLPTHRLTLWAHLWLSKVTTGYSGSLSLSPWFI